MKIIIIEDEALVANDLAASLKKIRPNVEIQQLLGSAKEAIAYFQNNPLPDLIFSDIQLGDGLSFEIAEHIQFTVPIIFCTAFDEYAIEAFKTNGIEYILKPFDLKSLEKALVKFENLKTVLVGDMANQYRIAMETLSKYQLKESGTYIVKYRDRFLPINYKNIALFYLENEINHLYTINGRVFYITESLEELEKKLKPIFYRVNRQFLINRSAIVDATEHFPRKLKINLTIQFDKDIYISKEKRAKVLAWLASETE